MNERGVSIIICCHNGALRLSETVRHIALQIVPEDIRWEFLLVDNGSTDNSVAVAEAVWTAYYPSGRFRVVTEPILGLSHARAKGFNEARYEFMLLCDDDNWLAPDYVKTAFDIMSERNAVGALGGLGTLYFETDPPPWIPNNTIFAAVGQQDQPGKVRNNRIYGAGCVIRKSAYLELKRAGFKSFLHDRTGSSLTSGGDYELCYALAILGYDIWYDDRLRFVHFITRERLTWNYFMKYARESCTCFDVLTSYKMVAAGLTAHEFPAVVIARDFFYCLRKFAQIGIAMIFTQRSSRSRRTLYFRYTIFRNKIVTYVRKYRQICRQHREIMSLKKNCAKLKEVRSAGPAISLEAPASTFSLKPFPRPQ